MPAPKFSKRQLTVVGVLVVLGVLVVAGSFLQVNLPSTTNSTSTNTQSNTTTSAAPPPTGACAASDAYKNAVKQNWLGGYSWQKQQVSIDELVQIAKNHGLQVSYGQFTIGAYTSPPSLYVPVPNYVYYYPCA